MISHFEFSASYCKEELGEALKQKGVTDCSTSAQVLDFMLQRSSEMQGVLGRLETSALSESVPIKPRRLLPHLFPRQL